MTISLDTLQEKRVALRSFQIQVLPNEVINDDQLDLADHALRINDPESRKKFCKLAIELLDACIDFYSSAATPIDIPSDSAKSIVNVALPATLISAGVAFYLWGPASALVVAGITYWFSATTEKNYQRQTQRAARDHNPEVAGWQEMIKDWREERDLLSDLLFKCDQTPEDRKLYADAEVAAKKRKVGLWADKKPVEPWEFRREKRGVK